MQGMGEVGYGKYIFFLALPCKVIALALGSGTKTTAPCMSRRAQQSARSLVELRVSSSKVGSGEVTAVPHKVVGALRGNGNTKTTLRMSQWVEENPAALRRTLQVIR